MRWLLYTTLVAAALAAVAIAVVDEPVARSLATRDTRPALWNQIIAALEIPLGIAPWKWTGVCVLVAGSLASLLVPGLRPHAHAWLLVTLVHLLGRNLSMWLKLLTGRLRPHEWLERGGGDTFFQGGHAFPSGHVILFASIALPLALVYPRARVLLAVAAFAMIARVAVNAHFISDVLAGLAITAAVTLGCSAALRRALRSPTRPPYPR